MLARANYACCAFVIVQNLAECRYGHKSNASSREAVPLTPIPAGACVDAVRAIQLRSPERRGTNYSSNASNFHAGLADRHFASVWGLVGLLGLVLRPWLRLICLAHIYLNRLGMGRARGA